MLIYLCGSADHNILSYSCISSSWCHQHILHCSDTDLTDIHPCLQYITITNNLPSHVNAVLNHDFAYVKFYINISKMLHSGMAGKGYLSWFRVHCSSMADPGMRECISLGICKCIAGWLTFCILRTSMCELASKLDLQLCKSIQFSGALPWTLYTATMDADLIFLYRQFPDSLLLRSQ